MILNCSLEPDAGIVNFYQEKVVNFNSVRYINNSNFHNTHLGYFNGSCRSLRSLCYIAPYFYFVRYDLVETFGSASYSAFV